MAIYNDTAHIDTVNNEVEVGKQYQYREDSRIIYVEVLKDLSDKYNLHFKLRNLSNDGFFPIEFEVRAIRGSYAYQGMWKLLPPDFYVSL